MSGITVKDHAVCIDLADLFDAMGDEDKEIALRSLMCEPVVVESLVGQLVTGWDEEGHYTYTNVLQECRKRLIEHLDPMTMKAVKGLLWDLRCAETSKARMHE